MNALGALSSAAEMGYQQHGGVVAKPFDPCSPSVNE